MSNKTNDEIVDHIKDGYIKASKEELETLAQIKYQAEATTVILNGLNKALNNDI